ncbi:Protein RDR1 [Lachnellula arida]|uniref:Protein RDR1 n=1 Tax=Lachnellula arida TaxID=1316785 RepID=A0A8T9B799_9HELO|nr:Protein RDR1 [Lachnellula arida]
MPPIRHTSSSPHIKVRQRSRRACAPCRKRKIKCDGDDPCAACTGYGYNCIYAERQGQASPKPPGLGSATTASIATPNSNGITISSNATEAPPLQRDDAPYLVAESRVPAADANGALLYQSIKTRSTTSSSAIAFPAKLGISLGVAEPPRLQAFAWNPGSRQETKFVPDKTICDIISLEQMKIFVGKYFKEVHIYFGIISQKESFVGRCVEFWASSNKHGTDFEALICGVVALGSYFSGAAGLPAEAEIVEHGRILLDLSTAHPPCFLSVKHVSAWVLRAIYLRCTTRPHLSWMASCTAVHVAEVLGLHRDIQTLRMTQNPPRNTTPLEEDLRRRKFWVAMALNQFLAAEYGRTRVQLDHVDCTPLLPKAGDLTAQTIAIMQSVPSSNSTVSDLYSALNVAVALPVDSPFHSLLRADVCFCIYRMFRSANLALSSSQTGALLEIIKVALDGVKLLRTMRCCWWNIIGTPFHCVCVLLSIATSESLAMIPNALETLKNTVAVYDSHISNEALRTAHALVQGAKAKMAREMQSLETGLSVVGDLAEDGPAANQYLEWAAWEDMGRIDYFDFGGYDDAGLLDSGLYSGLPQ